MVGGQFGGGKNRKEYILRIFDLLKRKNREKPQLMGDAVTLTYFWKYQEGEYFCIHSLDANRNLIDSSIYSVLLDIDNNYYKGYFVSELIERREEMLGDLIYLVYDINVENISYWSRNLDNKDIGFLIQKPTDTMVYSHKLGKYLV